MEPSTLEKYYKTLANRRRLAIIRYLNQTKEATVYQIAGKIKLSFKATSKHLQILKQVGFVASDQVGLEQHYYLADISNTLLKQVLNNL